VDATSGGWGAGNFCCLLQIFAKIIKFENKLSVPNIKRHLKSCTSVLNILRQWSVKFFKHPYPQDFYNIKVTIM
jgi:hypothetical protein